MSSVTHWRTILLASNLPSPCRIGTTLIAAWRAAFKFTPLLHPAPHPPPPIISRAALPLPGRELELAHCIRSDAAEQPCATLIHFQAESLCCI